MRRLSSAAILIALSIVLVSLACSTETVKEVPVEKVVTQEVVKEVPVERVIEVEKEVVRTVEVEKPVEVVREVVKEVEVPGETVVVEVEREVVKEVPCREDRDPGGGEDSRRHSHRHGDDVQGRGLYPARRSSCRWKPSASLPRSPGPRSPCTAAGPDASPSRTTSCCWTATYTLHPHVIKSWDIQR